MKQFLIIFICVSLLAPAAAVCAGGEAPVAKVTANEAVRMSWVMINDGALLIDVRSASEHESGHIEGSLNIPHTEIETLAEAIGADKDRQVVLYCRSGRRSGHAQEQLTKMGFTNVFNGTGYEALQTAKP
jgi:phage shock protein E